MISSLRILLLLRWHGLYMRHVEAVGRETNKRNCMTRTIRMIYLSTLSQTSRTQTPFIHEIYSQNSNESASLRFECPWPNGLNFETATIVSYLRRGRYAITWDFLASGLLFFSRLDLFFSRRYHGDFFTVRLCFFSITQQFSGIFSRILFFSW